MGSLTLALDRLLSSNSLRYSKSSSSSIQPVYVAFEANSDLCLSLLRSCADYGENVIGLPSIALSTSLRTMASRDLQERTTRLLFEMTDVSVENAASVRGQSSYQLTPFYCYHRHNCPLGSQRFKAAYNEALSLEQKTSSGLNSLLTRLSSRVTVTDGHGLPDGALPDVDSLKQLHKLWEKAGYFLRGTLATLKNEPAPKRPLFMMKRWLMHLVCFSL